ncbi:MAG: hypothetical protein ACO1NX_08990 [Chitinophagaceae bacterium]
MKEQQFIHTVNEKASLSGINPLLLLSGIEGLYTFKDVPISTINFEFLDSLILTIFALRVGDQFHTLAQQNLLSENDAVRNAAATELAILGEREIAASQNAYLQSFAQILSGKTVIRFYHVKALEVAALEIQKAQQQFGNSSIGTIVFDICQREAGGSLNLGAVFGS